MNETLKSIPGVGESLAKHLQDLGCEKVSDLKGQNAERMYDKLCVLRGEKIDRCVLYVFRCAVYYASNEQRKPELLDWWNWKD